MNDLLIKILLGFYLLLACVSAYEQQWAKMSYWIGAAIIVGSVGVMKG